MNDLHSNPTMGIIPQGNYGTSVDDVWTRYFDVREALASVDNKLKDKGSARTKEKYTRRAYEAGLLYFMNWAGPRLPDEARLRYTVYEFAERFGAHRFPSEALVQAYVAHHKDKGNKKSTIDSKYLAPLRHYIRALKNQMIPVTGAERDFVSVCKEALMAALDVKTTATEKITNTPALYQHGTRLSKSQVDEVLMALGEAGRDSLQAFRDLVIIYIGFNAGLRVSEIARMRLSSIVWGDKCWVIKVRGKNNNYQPIPIDQMCRDLVTMYVERFNDALEADDVRRIGSMIDGEEVALFQPLYENDNLPTVGQRLGGGVYDPVRGLAVSSMRDMVKRRSKEILGIEIAPHDMRRSMASILRDLGVGLDLIKVLLRHENEATTARYCGEPPNSQRAIPSNYLDWKLDVSA